MNRRQFLLYSAGLLSAGGIYSFLNKGQSGVSLSGTILGASHHIGHLLRKGNVPPPSRETKVPVVIVGAGIAGLSAGWKLLKSGFESFEILELEVEAGGNSRSGQNHLTPYPWGAHYVPLPTRESRAVRELLEELGVIESYTASGQPIYQEKYLCFSPQERLYLHGRWQEGLLPLVGVTPRDLDQYEKFREIIHAFRLRRGRDGRKAFAIPMEFSSQDKDLLSLDRISMRDFLHQYRLDSAFLHWYVNYACRDDYGCDYSGVSAWAGIHYFASRDAADHEIEDHTVLTWPEGNGWIVKHLKTKLQSHITTDALAFHLGNQHHGVIVDVYHPAENLSSRIFAEDVIFAAPQFVARRVLPDYGKESAATIHEFEYAPWLVANLTLKSFPIERAGTPIAWDNVIYSSDSLGYVVATHQSLRTHLAETVFTYYYPMTHAPPSVERNRLLETEWRSWADFILQDLAKPHPEIYSLVSHLDIMRP